MPMKTDFDKTVNALCRLADVKPIDWNALDRALSEIEDINIYDEDNDETLLSSIIMEGDFYEHGEELPEAIRHFIKFGYDVTKNDGLNGYLPLFQLCMSSYDRYILDAAKLLLDAGAPTVCKPTMYTEDADDEQASVKEAVDWDASYAWTVDGSYEWACILQAYSALIAARNEGKDYHLVNSFHECLNCTLSKVDYIPDGASLRREGDITPFHGTLVLWFGNRPLTVCKYVEFVVDPHIVEANRNRLASVDADFASLIGAKLIRLQYVDQSTCFLDFDNGCRILFTCFPDEEKEWCGAYEITQAVMVSPEEMKVADILRWSSPEFSSHTTTYDFMSIALKDAYGQAYLLFATTDETDTNQLECIKCSSSMLKEFTLRFSIKVTGGIEVHYSNGNGDYFQMSCGADTLFIVPSFYHGLDVKLFDSLPGSDDPDDIRSWEGKHIEFVKTSDC